VRNSKPYRYLTPALAAADRGTRCPGWCEESLSFPHLESLAAQLSDWHFRCLDGVEQGVVYIYGKVHGSCHWRQVCGLLRCDDRLIVLDDRGSVLRGCNGSAGWRCRSWWQGEGYQGREEDSGFRYILGTDCA